MRNVLRFLILIVLVAAGAIAKKAYLERGHQDRPEASEAKEANSAAEPILDLTEEQVGSVKIAKVGVETFIPTKQAVGNIDFNQNLLVQVFTPYQGRIINAYPNIGDKVEKDQVLFTIDSPDLLAAESTLIAAAGVLRLQNVTLSRAEKMKAFGGASQQSVDQSTSDQMTAEGALKSARDAVRIFGKTDTEIDKIIQDRKADPRLVVKSPITGYITARSAAPGLLIQPGVAPPPFIVADLSTMWMFANVVEGDAPALNVGQKVKARVAAFPNRDFDGTIVVLGPSVDPNSRRVSVRSEVNDPNHLLRAGMLADFTIQVADPISVTAVPEAAVVREGDGTMTAWTTQDRRRFTRKTLKIGMQQRGFDQVLAGLDPGEFVVTDGAVFLSNKYALIGNETD